MTLLTEPAAEVGDASMAQAEVRSHTEPQRKAKKSSSQKRGEERRRQERERSGRGESLKKAEQERERRQNRAFGSRTGGPKS